MNIVERIKAFDVVNPDWHLIDVVRNISFANLLDGTVETSLAINNVKHFVHCNIIAREKVHKDSYMNGKKVHPEEFVKESRSLTIQMI